MQEHIPITKKERTAAEERMLALARNLGSADNIDAQTGALVFTTKEEASAFQDFCKEQGLAVTAKEEPAKEAGGASAFIVRAEEGLKAGASSDTPPEIGKVEAVPLETPKHHFERVLKGRFSSVAKGTFTTSRAPFTSALIIPFEADGRASIRATLFYKAHDGGDTHATWNLLEDGALIGRIPKDLSQTREAIRREVLSVIEAMNPKQWYQTELEIIPDRDKGEERDEPRGEGEKGKPERPNDPERLRAMERLPGFKFGFVNKEKGFDGYRGAVVSGESKSAIVVDCEWIGNAGFVIPLTMRVDVKPESLNEEEVNRILETTWATIASKVKTRGQLLTQVPNVRRFVHAGEWQRKIREAVEQASN